VTSPACISCATRKEGLLSTIEREKLGKHIFSASQCSVVQAMPLIGQSLSF